MYTSKGSRVDLELVLEELKKVEQDKDLVTEH